MVPTSKKALFVLSSVNTSPINGEQAGWFLPEFAHPYAALEGITAITVASPLGGKAPLNEYSVEESKTDELFMRFVEHRSDLWASTEKLSDFKGRASDFDAIVYAGGQGPMFDIVADPVSQALIAEFWEAGKVVATVCHGSAALVNVKLSDGDYLIRNKKVTGFSDGEEQDIDAMPFSLETMLKDRSGGQYEKASALFAPHIVVAGNLVTGQKSCECERFRSSYSCSHIISGFLVNIC